MFSGGETIDHHASLGAEEPSLLAFATRNDGMHNDAESNLRLITASSRSPFRATDGVLLNVECFGPLYSGGNINASEDESTSQSEYKSKRSFHNADQWPMLLYVHGVCESAETWGVQSLAQYCAKHCWRLAVLELAGHGLSGDIGSGNNGGVGSVTGKGRATLPDFDELVQHVVEFTLHTGNMFPKSRGMILSGGSLGGTLVSYATKGILKAREEGNSKSPDFYGIALIAPAFGINPNAIPPSPVVLALRTLSYILPSQGILTPIEHPTYSCPTSSTRNFSGRWPLSTSNMLLDLTSRRIPNDVELNNVHIMLDGLPALCVIAGDRDSIVPISSIQEWFEAVSHLSTDNGSKKMIIIKGADHGFFHDRIKEGNRKKKNDQFFAESLFEWLNGIVGKDFQ